MGDPVAFVRQNTLLKPPSLVPELTLHLADKAVPLWELTEAELAEKDLPPPYWAFAWAGGQALARYCLDNPDIVRGRHVLDFAAGSGLTGIAALKSGTRTVEASELDAFAIAAIEANAADGCMHLTANYCAEEPDTSLRLLRWRLPCVALQNPGAVDVEGVARMA